MAKKNLWGKISGADDIVTPTQILKEQASQLTDLTKGILEGQVRVLGKCSATIMMSCPIGGRKCRTATPELS